MKIGTPLFKMMRLRRSSALQTHYLTLSNVGIIGDFYAYDYDNNFDDTVLLLLDLSLSGKCTVIRYYRVCCMTHGIFT